MNNEGIRVALNQKIEEVERAYQIQSGGEGVCRLHKDGRVTGGLKFEEGRLVVLLWARRQLNQADYSEVVKAELLNWQSELQLLQQKQPTSLSWVAYRQGGLDALLFVVELATNAF